MVVPIYKNNSINNMSLEDLDRLVAKSYDKISYVDIVTKQCMIVIGKSLVPYRPTRDWISGGPIISDKNISIEYAGRKNGEELWRSFIGFNNYAEGPTPLIAAMRVVAYHYLENEKKELVH